MNFKIVIVTSDPEADMGLTSALFDNYEQVEAAGYKRGERLGASHLREELRGQPSLDRLCGPMWGGWRDQAGEGIYFQGSGDDPNGEIASYSPSQGPVDHYLIRYEDYEANERLSR